MPSAKKRKAANISTEGGNNARNESPAAAPAPPASKGKSKTRRLKNTEAAAGSNGTGAAAAAKPAVRRSSLKGPGAAPRGLPLRWVNANGRPLGYASPNFSAASAVAHDPERITKPSSTRRNNKGALRMYNVPKLIGYLSHPSIRYSKDREAYLNYVLAFIQKEVSTTEEMIAAIKGLPADAFTPDEKMKMLQKLFRSYKMGNFSEKGEGEGEE
jgi:hypothetical protein